MTNHALRNRKILVTRPRDQAVALAQRIAAAGGIPLLFPLLEIAPSAHPLLLQQQLAHLEQYQLLIFISPNAVQYGMAAIRLAGGLPTGAQIATVGAGSAKALREAGITSVMVPAERFDSEGLLALPELQQVVGKRVLILRGDAGRELLGDTLKARGATVEYASCYQRSKPLHDGHTLLQLSPDAITVTSSEALGYLWQMLDEDARQRIAALPLFVPHVRIAALAQQQGWRNVQVSAAGDDGLLAALVAWAEHKEIAYERNE